jgi:hypothetical protein
MAALLSIDELYRRHVAAWEEYLSDNAPDNTRRQVFTGDAEGVTDRRREYHVEMAALDKAVFATRRKLRQAREARQNWSEEEVRPPLSRGKKEGRIGDYHDTKKSKSWV